MNEDQELQSPGRSLSIAYLVAIVVVTGFSIFGIVGYSIYAPDVGHGTFIVFVGGLSVPITVALVAFIRTEQQAVQHLRDRMESREDAKIAREEARRAREEARLTTKEILNVKAEVIENSAITQATHKLVNSQLEEFKNSIEELATERGYKAGMEQGRAEADARTDALSAGTVNPLPKSEESTDTESDRVL